MSTPTITRDYYRKQLRRLMREATEIAADELHHALTNLRNEPTIHRARLVWIDQVSTERWRDANTSPSMLPFIHKRIRIAKEAIATAAQFGVVVPARGPFDLVTTRAGKIYLVPGTLPPLESTIVDPDDLG